MKYPAVIFLALFLCSCTCNQGTDEKAGIPEINTDKLPDVKIKIKRYEKAIFSVDQNNLAKELKRIQPEFAIFLDGDLDNKENLMQMEEYLKAPEIKDNYDACMKKYPNLTGIEKELSGAMSYYKYYFPKNRIPEFYSYVSGGDFAEPIKNADSAMIIALDIYLGSDYPMYASYRIPNYKSRWMDSPCIVRDCMEELAINACSTESDNATFLDQMVSMGKVMYVLDATMPQTPDSIKIKYSQAQLDWCKKNEGNIWAFFIENKLLYTKDRDDFTKFFSDGPFTNAFGKESPPRIAIWEGWQITLAYMKEVPDADIKSLLAEKDSQKILQASKYKPKKEKK
jgi:hypothetical protein